MRLMNVQQSVTFSQMTNHLAHPVEMHTSPLYHFWMLVSIWGCKMFGSPHDVLKSAAPHILTLLVRLHILCQRANDGVWRELCQWFASRARKPDHGLSEAGQHPPETAKIPQSGQRSANSCPSQVTHQPHILNSRALEWCGTCFCSELLAQNQSWGPQKLWIKTLRESIWL